MRSCTIIMSNSSIAFSLFLICFIAASLATKRGLDEPESSARASKYQRTEVVLSIEPDSNEHENDDIVVEQIGIREMLLDMVNWSEIIDIDCRPEVLGEYIDRDEKSSTDFLGECNSKFETWLKKKFSRIGDLKFVLTRWLYVTHRLVKERADAFDLILAEKNKKNYDLRSIKVHATKLRNTWTTWSKDEQRMSFNIDNEMSENGKRVYYYGDGICIHILSPPFNRVELFMDVVVKDFQRLKYVQDFTMDPHQELPTCAKIHLLQKMCRKFYKAPREWKTRSIIVHRELNLLEELESIDTSYLIKYIEDIKNVENKGKLTCSWVSVYKRNQAYRLLHSPLILGDPDFLSLKQDVDELIDKLLKECLETLLESNGGSFEIYTNVDSLAKKGLLRKVSDLLRKTIKDYVLPFDESINFVLDVRWQDNKFRKALIEKIEHNIQNEFNLKLAKIFIQLLDGRLGNFDRGIFKKPSLNESKTLELLFQIFDIKGYKPDPDFKSPLLDFYYLYKISEICNMIPINEKIDNQDDDDYDDYDDDDDDDDIDDDYKEISLRRIEKLEIFDDHCTPNGLSYVKISESESEVTDFLENCESQAQTWLKEKVGRLDLLGELILRSLKSLLNFVNRSKQVAINHNLDLLLSNDHSRILNLRSENKEFISKLRYIPSTREERESSKFGKNLHKSWYYFHFFGDGFCVHLLSAPFDRVETLTRTLLHDFKNLKYVKNFKTSPDQMSTSLKIYLLQKLCRIFNKSPENPSSKQISIKNIDAICLDSHYAFSTLSAMDHSNGGERNKIKCDWTAVFSRKQAYRLLNALDSDRMSSKLMKDKVDNSINMLVKHCLSTMETSSGDVSQIYSRVKNLEKKNLLLEVASLLRTTISAYVLPRDQSINSALDIRSSNNQFKQVLLTEIKKKISDTSNMKLVKLFSDLLFGRLGNVKRHIFRKPIYENKLVEYESLDFLTHIFDIKGYKLDPDFKSPLLDFYYLYKISEICNMIQIEFVD